MGLPSGGQTGVTVGAQKGPRGRALVSGANRAKVGDQLIELGDLAARKGSRIIGLGFAGQGGLHRVKRCRAEDCRAG